MKRVVSVSLGSSKRDKRVEAEFFGEPFLIERIGTDGDLRRFAEWLQKLDGKVDALCFGGMDIWLRCGRRKYALREAWQLAQLVRKTPVVDGSGVKDTVEREAVHWLQRHGVVDFQGRKVLLVSAVDRFGMAEEFWALGADLRVGDLAFGLGIPVLLKSQRAYETLGTLLLPLLTQLPIRWLYPTGKEQERIVPKFAEFYAWAEVIAGDFLLIRKHLPMPTSSCPKPLQGKIVLTNTTTPDDVALLWELGLATLITTTPELNGRTFGTNVLEGIIVAHFQRCPEELTRDDYLRALSEMGWKPTVRKLNA